MAHNSFTREKKKPIFDMKSNLLFIGCISARKGPIQIIDVVGRMTSPKAVHDACNANDHSSDLHCSMNDAHMECALNPCGGQKYKCDCNVYT